jgi:ribulose-5-phosphate 4-epimerase/fuculose-1-phosphate aldolase
MNVATRPAALVGCSPEEWQIRCDLAALYRLVAHQRRTDFVYTHISARLPGPKESVADAVGDDSSTPGEDSKISGGMECEGKHVKGDEDACQSRRTFARAIDWLCARSQPAN